MEWSGSEVVEWMGGMSGECDNGEVGKGRMMGDVLTYKFT